MLLWGLVAVGVATAVVLGLVVVALIRHLRDLGVSAHRLNEELAPMLVEIQRDSERARERAERLSDRLPDAGR